MAQEKNMTLFKWRPCLWVLLAVLGISVKAVADDPANPPFAYVWGQAYHVLPETHNGESGYFSLCEGVNGNIYVGTAKYGENAYLVEFDPKTEKQRIVIDTNEVCNLNPTGPNAAQCKIHTRNFVGPSGKIYVGSMGAPPGVAQLYLDSMGIPRKEEDPSVYAGGYVMTYDPETDRAENLGMPYPGLDIIDVVADEERGLIYVVTDDADPNVQEHWMLYDVKTKKYRELGPRLVTFGTTLVDSKGRTNAITGDGRLAQYDPATGKVTVRAIVVEGRELAGPLVVPAWNLAADGRTAYLIQMSDPTLFEIDLLSEGELVQARSHGKMIEGKGYDSRCALSIGPDGRVYAVVRIDNATGFGGDYLHHLVRFDPKTKEMTDLGVLTVKNPAFFFHSPGARRSHLITGSEKNPSYYGYHILPDGTMTPRLHHLAMIVTRDGTVYVTILYPFTLLKIDADAYRH